MAIYIGLSIIAAFFLGMLNGKDLHELEEGEKRESGN